MDPLLARQLRKHLPSVNPEDGQWRSFLSAVENAYLELRQDRAFIEHTLETTSLELTEANEKLRRDAESQLASLNRYFQQTLELQQGMILCVRKTPGGFVHTLCRGELARRLGLDPEQVEGRTVDQVAAESNVAEINAAYARAWAGEQFSYTYINVRTGIEVLVQVRPRRDRGEVCEVIAACVDITTLKETERALIAARDRAQAADRAKSDFLAVMSHEIRTPLNAVLGFSSLLETSPLNAEQQVWLRTICASGESLLTLIDDILDFSKIEAGHLALHLESVSLPTLLNDVASMFHERAAAKGLAIDMMMAVNLPATILTDAHRLRQILVNLTANAVKFTRKGAIRVEARVVEPERGSDGCLIRFAVTDTGIGIPRERLERLFKPFSQVDSSTTRNFGGTGLGLAICHRLSRLLGGDIGVETTPEVGSTFFFTIRAPIVQAPQPTAVPVVAKSTGAVPAGLRVLVAEDHAPNRQLIHDLLTGLGLKPDIVEDGQRAIYAAIGQAYDIILMDLLMPGIDGYAATRAICRHFAAGGRPRIYALTANVFPEDRIRCREAGMDGVLTKPIDVKELVKVLAGGQPGERPL